MDDFVAAAFADWQKGEAGGGYDDFVARLCLPGAFERFSHPIAPRGVHDGADGHARLLELIAARTATPNALTFSSITRLASADGRTAFFFDSAGQVSGGFPYQGYNCIVLTVRADTIVGFREYLGDVEPTWFTGGASQ